MLSDYTISLFEDSKILDFYLFIYGLCKSLHCRIQYIFFELNTSAALKLVRVYHIGSRTLKIYF